MKAGPPIGKGAVSPKAVTQHFACDVCSGGLIQGLDGNDEDEEGQQSAGKKHGEKPTDREVEDH